MEIGDIMAIIEYAMLTLMYLLMGVAVFIFIPAPRSVRTVSRRYWKTDRSRQQVLCRLAREKQTRLWNSEM